MKKLVENTFIYLENDLFFVIIKLLKPIRGTYDNI